jgi:cytochrome c-type biogenesis protein
MNPTTLLPLAFSAGGATFFAPCAFPLLPGYVSYFLGVSSEEATGTGLDRVRNPLVRAVVVSITATVGMTLVYVGLAGTVAVVGAGALADIAVLELVVGGVFLLAGGSMAAGWKPSRSPVRLPERRRSLVGVFSFGVLYAAAAAGCTAPLFVAVVVRAVAAGPAAGAAATLAYALGMGTVMVVLTGAFALGGSSVAGWLGRRTGTIYRVAGGLLALSGVAEIYYYVAGFPDFLGVRRLVGLVGVVA